VPKVGAGILIAAGLVMLINFGHQAVQALHSSSWPTVEGMVAESKVVQHTGRRGRKTDVPSISYRYSVDGIEHVSTRLFFGSQYSSSWTSGAKWTTDTQEYMARYSPGASVRVYYDPDHAATSVVEAGLKPAIVLPVVLAFWSIAGGVFVGLVERRRAAKLARRESTSKTAT
jgi:hypothetical protein